MQGAGCCSFHGCQQLVGQPLPQIGSSSRTCSAGCSSNQQALQEGGPLTRLQLRDGQALVLLQVALLQQLGVHACGREKKQREGWPQGLARASSGIPLRLSPSFPSFLNSSRGVQRGSAGCASRRLPAERKHVSQALPAGTQRTSQHAAQHVGHVEHAHVLAGGGIAHGGAEDVVGGEHLEGCRGKKSWAQGRRAHNQECKRALGMLRPTPHPPTPPHTLHPPPPHARSLAGDGRLLAGQRTFIASPTVWAVLNLTSSGGCAGPASGPCTGKPAGQHGEQHWTARPEPPRPCTDVRLSLNHLAALWDGRLHCKLSAAQPGAILCPLVQYPAAPTQHVTG